MNAEQFVRQSGIKMDATYVTKKDASQWYQHGVVTDLEWVIKLTKGEDSMRVIYRQGLGYLPDSLKQLIHRPKSTLADKEMHAVTAAVESGKHNDLPLTPPDLIDVLHSLLMDSSVSEYPVYEEWAGEFGYEEDSRKGEAIYKQCIEQTMALSKLVDLSKGRDAFCDY